MLICSQMRNSTLKEERRSNETKAKPMKCEESSKISYEICMKVRKAGNLVDRAGWLLKCDFLFNDVPFGFTFVGIFNCLHCLVYHINCLYFVCAALHVKFSSFFTLFARLSLQWLRVFVSVVLF